MVVLQGEGVYLAKKGYIENLVKPGGFSPFTKLTDRLQGTGGSLKVCVPCIKERNIEASDLIEGAQTTAAGRLITEALEADAVFTY